MVYSKIRHKGKYCVVKRAMNKLIIVATFVGNKKGLAAARRIKKKHLGSKLIDLLGKEI